MTIRGYITTDNSGSKRVIRKYNRQLYACEFNKMNQFLEKHKLSKLTEGEKLWTLLKNLKIKMPRTKLSQENYRPISFIMFIKLSVQSLSSVHFSHSVVSDSLWSHERQHARLPCPSPTPEACSNSCPSSRWCHLTISSFIVPLSSCLQSSPESGSFPVSQFFTSGGQSTGVSTLASVLPMNIKDCFSLGWTGWISLQSKGLPRVFSNTTV